MLFAPEDLALVKGDPSERRRFLDDLLVLRQPRFAGVRSDYDRVLKQRNALLKSGAGRRAEQVDLRTLEVWDAHLAAVGAELLAARLDLVDALRPLVDKAYSRWRSPASPRAVRPRWTTAARCSSLGDRSEGRAGRGARAAS